jgi:hypothetical protein
MPLGFSDEKAVDQIPIALRAVTDPHKTANLVRTSIEDKFALVSAVPLDQRSQSSSTIRPGVPLTAVISAAAAFEDAGLIA